MPGRTRGRWVALASLALAAATLAPARAADRENEIGTRFFETSPDLGLHGRWVYAATDHFEIYTDDGDRHARETLANFERVHAFFAGFLSLPPYNGDRTRIVLFADANEYAKYRPSGTATAFYQAGADRDYIVMHAADAGGQRTIVHEYTHAVIRRTNEAFPLWLNEGLATFFSTMTTQGNKMRLGAAPPARMSFTSGVPMIPLDRLLTITTRSPEYSSPQHAGTFYSESWALTHMLLADERYRTGWAAFLGRVTSGVPAARALSDTYGQALAAIERDLKNYLFREDYGYWLADYSPPPGVNATTRPISDFDAGLVAANLLAGNAARTADAATAFAALMRQNPESPELVESEALFEFRRGHQSVAEPLMTRAMVLGSRSVELRIRFAETMAMHDHSAEALAELASLRPVPPNMAFLYYQVLANAQLQNGDMVDARQSSVNVVGAARPGAESRVAAQFKELIDRAAGDDTYVDGRLVDVACGANPTIIAIATKETTLRLAIDDPSKVKVRGRGTGGPTVDLECGAQDTPIRVGYRPASGGTLGAMGFVRVLDWRPR